MEAFYNFSFPEDYAWGLKWTDGHALQCDGTPEGIKAERESERNADTPIPLVQSSMSND